ncbi:ATP-grasp domain-containing protein [Streptosporangium sp. NPDC006007]|uniref:ATP-grasp domain-containing protein n=1 Tax=Streptosporangium sp. NPDC006007 TaxID=3154575 RepID=UPI0033B89D55
MRSAEVRPIAVLVDAYTTGNHLPPAFDKLGVDVIHVQSTPELMTSMMPPDLTLYRAVVPYGTPEQTAARLAEYQPICVIPGQEPGVRLADELSERLGLPTNGTELSAARRDKYEMIEALRAKVRCADQFKSDNAQALVEWAESRGRYPVVVKPLSSAASEGVAVCRSPEEVRKAAEAVLGTRNIFLEANDEVLIQSFLPGEEYMVDTVSYAGRRYVTGVWEYRKRLRGTHRVYDQETLVSPELSPVPELVAYMHEVLDALGVRYGPVHAEVIMTPEGPALVEIGARLSGSVLPAYNDLCHGANQADVTALAYARPEEFLGRYAGRTYEKLREAAVIDTATELEGVVESIDQEVFEEIEALESVHFLRAKLRPGGLIRPTVDLYTSTLVAYTVHGSLERLRQDYERIQQLKDRVYRLRDDTETDRDR